MVGIQQLVITRSSTSSVDRFNTQYLHFDRSNQFLFNLNCIKY